MKYFLIILLLSISTDKKPTSQGIDKYIIDNQKAIIYDFQKFIKDNIYDIYISTEDFKSFSDYDSTELGRFYVPDEIIINNQSKYFAYDYNELNGIRKKFYYDSNRFVRSVLIHELSHCYFYLNILRARTYQLSISPDYNIIRLFPSNKYSFSSSFIEEGVCEYISRKMTGTKISNDYIPKTKEEILDPNNNYLIKYQYSSYYVKDFIDSVGLKKAIKIFIRNKAPDYDEILDKKLFFKRLE